MPSSHHTYKVDLIISIPILQMERLRRMVKQLPLDHMLVSTNDVIQAQRTRLISLTEFCLLILFVSYCCSYGWVSIRYKQNSKRLRT